MAVPLEKVSPRTFMPRHDCPPGHWCLGMNVPSRHYCPPMPDIFFLGTGVPPPPPPPQVGRSPTFAYWVSSLYLDLYSSDSVCGLYYYHIQPTYAIRCMGTNPGIPDLPPIREGTVGLRPTSPPSTFSRLP